MEDLPDPTPGEIEPLVTFPQLLKIEGIGKSVGYRRLADGEYTVYRDGDKKLLISTRSILARRERHLKQAKFGARKGIRGFPRKEATVTA